MCSSGRGERAFEIFTSRSSARFYFRRFKNALIIKLFFGREKAREINATIVKDNWLHFPFAYLAGDKFARFFRKDSFSIDQISVFLGKNEKYWNGFTVTNLLAFLKEKDKRRNCVNFNFKTAAKLKKSIGVCEAGVFFFKRKERTRLSGLEALVCSLGKQLIRNIVTGVSLIFFVKSRGNEAHDVQVLFFGEILFKSPREYSSFFRIYLKIV